MALAAALTPLPADFGGAVIVIQHVDAQFSAGLASWLNQQTQLDTKLATDGCRPEPGTVWVAGTNNHLVMQPNLTLTYTAEPRSYLYRPSVDVFFESLALHWPSVELAILLTGMGSDGAQGLKTLRDKGWQTMAQDEASSVVYGMPKAAARMGAAGQILGINLIGPAILDVITDRRSC